MGAEYQFHYDLPKVAPPDRSEEQIQAAFIGRLRVVAPRIRVVASLNGVRTSRTQALAAKRTGMSKGFPDTQCLAGGGLCAFIEFKSKSGSLSAEQVEWLNWLRGCGFPVAVCRHPDTAAEWLRVQGFPFMGRIAA